MGKNVGGLSARRLINHDPTDDPDLDPYYALANSIVLQAVEDFKYAVAEDQVSRKIELYRFFGSRWCIALTELDMPSIAKKLERRVEEFLRLAVRQPNLVRKNWEELTKYDYSYCRFPHVRAFKCPICGSTVYTRWGKCTHEISITPTGRRSFRTIYGWVVGCSGCTFKRKFPDEETMSLVELRTEGSV